MKSSIYKVVLDRTADYRIWAMEPSDIEVTFFEFNHIKGNTLYLSELLRFSPKELEVTSSEMEFIKNKSERLLNDVDGVRRYVYRLNTSKWHKE